MYKHKQNVSHLLRLLCIHLGVGGREARDQGNLVRELLQHDEDEDYDGDGYDGDNDNEAPDVDLDAVHYEGRRVVGGLDDAAGQPGALAHQLGGAAVTNQG